MNVFQQHVKEWVHACMGAAVATNKQERNYRFLEESLELVQSLGCSKEDALRLIEYVYSRPIGEPRQEIGGVMVTLAALAEASNFCMQWAGEDELDRIKQPEIMEKIRKKHNLKTISVARAV